MINKGTLFFCERWHQYIYERLCMHRYRKGLKKCKGCMTGEELIRKELHILKQEAAQLAGSRR